MSRALVSCSLLLVLIHHVKSHGRLMEPPARNAMWRFGFPNPVNYNDNGTYFSPTLHFTFFRKGFYENNFNKLFFLITELFCGGYAGKFHSYKLHETI